MKRQKDGDSQPKAKAKAKAKASSGGVGDWTLFAELPHVGELELDSAVAGKDKDVIRAFVNSLVAKNATYSWVVTGGDLSKATAEHTVQFEEKVWGAS